MNVKPIRLPNSGGYTRINGGPHYWPMREQRLYAWTEADYPRGVLRVLIHDAGLRRNVGR